MEDLQYIFNIGFAGSDFWRALWVGLLASLIATRNFRPWKVGILAFLLDRLWPYYGMHQSGHENDAIWAAMWATLMAIPQDITFYVVRYLGILGLVYLGYNIRKFLHENAPKGEKRTGGLYPY